MSPVRFRLAVLVLAAGVAFSGCSTSLEPYLPEPQEVSVEELWMRPSSEDAAAELESMLAEVRSRFESELSLGGWEVATAGSRSGCGMNVGPEFEERNVVTWKRATGPIPDEDWLRALEIVTEVGEKYGFGAPQVVEARPGQYDATAFAPQTAASMNIGSQRLATMTARTGCHPTAAALAERVPPS